MKRQLLKSALIAVTGVGLLASVSVADTFYNRIDTDVTFDSSHTTYTWTWNLDTADNLVGWTGSNTSPTPNNIAKDVNFEDTITLANLYINFKDDDSDDGHWVWWPIWYENGETENANGSYDNVPVWSAEINGGLFFANVTAYLQTDHTFSLKIDRTSGDFEVDYAKLYGKFTDNPAVPEPATMLLFGTGLAGLAMATRRKRN